MGPPFVVELLQGFAVYVSDGDVAAASFPDGGECFGDHVGSVGLDEVFDEVAALAVRDDDQVGVAGE